MEVQSDERREPREQYVPRQSPHRTTQVNTKSTIRPIVAKGRGGSTLKAALLLLKNSHKNGVCTLDDALDSDVDNSVDNTE